jgi:hypothetical protein
VLDERLAAHEANPEPTTPWEEVREEIRSMASSMRASEYVAEQMRVGNL